MRTSLLAPVAVLFLQLSGCASYTALAPADRELLERELTARDGTAYLRLSYHVTPFFGDASKKLLTPVLPEQVRLLEGPAGDSISPGPVEKTLPAGRRVRVLKIEFPTSWAVTERMVFTPRTQPWVFLAVEGEKNEVPFVLVLRPQLRTPDEVARSWHATSPPRISAPSWSASPARSVRQSSARTWWWTCRPRRWRWRGGTPR